MSTDDIRNLAAVKVATDLLTEANARLIEFRNIRTAVTSGAATTAEKVAQAVAISAALNLLKVHVDAAIASPNVAAVAGIKDEVADVSEIKAAVATVAEHIELVQDASFTLEGIHATLLQIAADYADLSERFTSLHGFE